MGFAIDPEIIRKDQAIPGMIAKLSYFDQSKAVEFIRQYGEMSVPVTPMYESLSSTLIEVSKETEAFI